MTKPITHAIDFVSQLVAALFADKEQPAVVIRREQRKAQSSVKGKQALVLIAGEQRAHQALEDDDTHGQEAEKESRLVSAPFLQ